MSFSPDWSEALDITHAVGKLRIVGQLHYGDGSAAKEYGRERLLLLLEGRFDDVIEDFETALEDGTLSRSNAKELNTKALGYFRNNRHRMAYDRLLAKGLPIASGIIESACNTLINIRMEGPGMFWSVDGAEASHTNSAESFWMNSGTNSRLSESNGKRRYYTENTITLGQTTPEMKKQKRRRDIKH